MKSKKLLIDSIGFRNDLIEVTYLNKHAWKWESVLFKKQEFEQWLHSQWDIEISSYWDDMEDHIWQQEFTEERIYKDIERYFLYKLNLEDPAYNFESVKKTPLATATGEGTEKSDPERDELLDLLTKAVATIEEVYEKDFDLLHEDNAIDYKDMVEALNQYGVKYVGREDILELAKSPDFSSIQNQKKPMKRATGRKKTSQRENQQGRKLG